MYTFNSIPTFDFILMQINKKTFKAHYFFIWTCGPVAIDFGVGCDLRRTIDWCSKGLSSWKFNSGESYHVYNIFLVSPCEPFSRILEHLKSIRTRFTESD